LNSLGMDANQSLKGSEEETAKLPPAEREGKSLTIVPDNRREGEDWKKDRKGRRKQAFSGERSVIYRERDAGRRNEIVGGGVSVCREELKKEKRNGRTMYKNCSRTEKRMSQGGRGKSGSRSGRNFLSKKGIRKEKKRPGPLFPAGQKRGSSRGMRHARRGSRQS